MCKRWYARHSLTCIIAFCDLLPWVAVNKELGECVSVIIIVVIRFVILYT